MAFVMSLIRNAHGTHVEGHVKIMQTDPPTVNVTHSASVYVKNIITIITTADLQTMSAYGHGQTERFTFQGTEYVTPWTLMEGSPSVTVSTSRASLLDVDGKAIACALGLHFFFYVLSKIMLAGD
ncbi:hypothetical protein Plec18167_006160 [Paecilomyces lecythidis]|uniref:Uncharacterized protein n=1 Tax=Paecilomyces lecythidis TaxID=3004212 RepID=A0ABR3XDF0_9EURO